MSFRLHKVEKLNYGVRRIAFEEIDDALDYLQAPGDDLDDAVHESRKCFKKLRGLLRLLRKEIGETVYKRENICFRDAGRLLSDLRDSRVMINTLDSLAEEEEHTEGTIEIDAETLQKMRNELQTSYRQTRKRVVEGERALEKASDMICAASDRIDEWPIKQDSFAAVAGGLRKVYKRGRNRQNDAMDNRVAGNFHEWRKRVKYLWYNIRILRPIWPEPMATLADEIHDLSDYLGDEHDLAELEVLIKTDALSSDDVARYSLLSVLRRKRSRLQDKAFQQGQRIYPESPDEFVQRIGAYWDAVW